MYENYYYQMMTTQELEMVVYDTSQLDGYRKRCEQELIKRYQEEQEFTQL